MYVYISLSRIAHCLSLPPIGSCCNVFNMYLICMYVFLQKCILLFGVGLLFLILSFVIIPLIKSESNFISLLGESSSIVGWVFMWDLVEILSFEVTKLHKKRRYLNRLINSKVEFETY